MRLWQPGRTSPQSYFKLLLGRLWFADLYILKFPPGSSIDWHTDPVNPGLQHHRLNVFLRRPRVGCQIMTKFLALDGEKRGAQKLTMRHKPRWHYMRPDVTEHAVNPNLDTKTGYILSLGWVTKEKQ